MAAANGVSRRLCDAEFVLIIRVCYYVTHAHLLPGPAPPSVPPPPSSMPPPVRPLTPVPCLQRMQVVYIIEHAILANGPLQPNR
jgi:hypothetical protein